jgi:hypothetical protein
LFVAVVCVSSDPVSFGPYPVNRFVQGLEGNMKVVISDIRDGILQHTGEWPNWFVLLTLLCFVVTSHQLQLM